MVGRIWAQPASAELSPTSGSQVRGRIVRLRHRKLRHLWWQRSGEHLPAFERFEESAAAAESLRDQAAAAERQLFAGYLDYAERHRRVIRRFGRFPHRNAVLGRQPREAELAAGDVKPF